MAGPGGFGTRSDIGFPSGGVLTVPVVLKPPRFQESGFGEQVKQVPSGSWGKTRGTGKVRCWGIHHPQAWLKSSIGDNPFTSRHDIACVASPGVLFALPGETGM